jgi:hypothetical protein
MKLIHAADPKDAIRQDVEERDARSIPCASKERRKGKAVDDGSSM